MKLHVQKTEFKMERPFWTVAASFFDQRCGFLLDSAMDQEKLGRHSFIGGRPAALLKAKRLCGQGGIAPFQIEIQRWTDASGQACDCKSVTKGDPFEALRTLQNEYGRLEKSEAEFPLNGGLVGCLGYETGHAVEDLPDQGLDDLNLPDLIFQMTDEVFVHDHQQDQSWLVVTGRGPDAETARQDCEKRTAELLERVGAAPLQEALPPVHPLAPEDIRAHFDKSSYMEAVEQCRRHILAGDVFEVCLTHRLETDLKQEPWHLYRRLRDINPAPFASYLHFPGFQVVSASPERFMRLNRDGVAESRPIKGTRPRGDNPWDDQRLRDDLQNSEKDRSENVMIVDLVRNDIGRVAEIGSVQVPELLVVEPYATVFQLVSTITGKLKKSCDAFDLARHCFPGGSMTGAPKIEAMKIIDSIEPVKRSLYSGAIGYFDRCGAMDLSIVIRTMVCSNNKVTFGVGGAVVADSDPAEEYQETLDKARALLRALGLESEGEACR